MLASRSRAANISSNAPGLNRGRSRSQIGIGQGHLASVSAADIMELEQRAKKVSRSHFDWKNYEDVIPLIACLVWQFGGTVFYAVHDNFGWPLGLYMSVNIGWSIGWVTPSVDDHSYESFGSKLFSAIHNSIGVVFVGIAVMYMARRMTENKEGWMAEVLRRKQVAAAAKTEGYYDDFVALFVYYAPKYKVIVLFLLWIVFGVVFTAAGVGFEMGKSFDFVLSTLSGAGYISLPDGSPNWQYVIVALYTCTGVPICAIAVGMILSFILVSEDNSVLEKIVADVTDQEISFMKMFEIDDGDGTLDCQEFIILTVVRIGAAPPALIAQINERFAMLDRKHEGSIKYEDIVHGFKREAKRNRFKAAVGKQILQRSGKYNVVSSSLDMPASPKADTLPGGDEKGLSMTGHRVHPTESMFTAPVTPGQEVEVAMPFDDIENCKSPSVKSQSDMQGHVEGISISCTTGVKPYDYSNYDCNDALENGVGNTGKCEAEVAAMPNSLMNSGSDSPLHSISPQTTVKPQATAVTKGASTRSINFDEDDGLISNRLNRGETKQSLTGADQSAWNRPLVSPSSSRVAPLGMLRNDQISSSALGFTGATKLLQLQRSLEEENVEDDLLMKDAALYSRKMSRFIVQHNDEKSSPSMDSLSDIMRCDDVTFKRQMRALCGWVWIRVAGRARDPYFQAFVAWLIWLTSGTIFYMTHLQYGTSIAIFRSVSVGYGIFWVAIEEDTFSETYIRLHFVIGVAAIGGMMAVFARSLADSKSRWYVEAMKLQALEAATETEGYWDDIIAYVKYYEPKVRVHVFFVLWAVVGIAVTISVVDWPFVNGLFFSLATMTTGGIFPLPDDAPTLLYLFTAIYILVGVPLMAVSFGLMANAVTSMGDTGALEDKMSARITTEELAMMKSFGIEDGNGFISNKEYVVLILVRIGALAPDLIHVINTRFQTLDVNRTGSISYNDLQAPHKVEGVHSITG